MSQPRRRVSKIILSLSLTATMVAGLGYGVAGASNFDVADKPLDLGNPEVGMTIEQSQFIAHQLRPVPLKLRAPARQCRNGSPATLTMTPL